MAWGAAGRGLLLYVFHVLAPCCQICPIQFEVSVLCADSAYILLLRSDTEKPSRRGLARRSIAFPYSQTVYFPPLLLLLSHTPTGNGNPLLHSRLLQRFIHSHARSLSLSVALYSEIRAHHSFLYFLSLPFLLSITSPRSCLSLRSRLFFLFFLSCSSLRFVSLRGGRSRTGIRRQVCVVTQTAKLERKLLSASDLGSVSSLVSSLLILSIKWLSACQGRVWVEGLMHRERRVVDGAGTLLAASAHSHPVF